MTSTLRTALLGTVTTAALVAFATPAAAQSTCSLTTPGATFTLDCTSPNGDGQIVGLSPGGTSLDTTNFILSAFGGDLQSLTATGYFETTAAGIDGISLSTSEPLLTYVGTSSTIYGDPAATGVTLLDITADSIVANTGNIIAEGAGSTGVLLTSTGGAGSGGIDATIDGIVAVMGNAVVVNQSNVAADGDVNVTLNSGDAVLANGGSGIDVTSEGAGNITVTNNGAIGSYGTPNTLTTGINAFSNGTGDVTVNGTGIIGSATDRATVGVYAEITNAASAGDVLVDLSGSGATWASNTGIIAQNGGTGNTTVLTGGAIDSSGNAIVATTTTGDTMVTANGAINAGGIGIDAVSAGGDVMVNNAAAITAAGDGIVATTTGAGNITVTRTGSSNLTSNGGVGISTNGGTGLTTISTGTGTVSGSTSGIQAVSTGTQSITANGNVTGGTVAGIHSDTTANRTLTVAAGRTVSGGTEAVLLTNTGTATINNSGTIGAASTGLAVQATGAGATTVNNLAGANLNGRLLLTGNADVVTNAGTFTTQGTSDFGAGTDQLTNSAGGVITLAGATTLANLETLTNAGTLNVNNALTFTGVPTAIGNTGTITLGANVTGAGAVTNQTGGTINLNGRTITGTGAFVNNGTITGGATGAGLLGFTTQSNVGTFNLAPGTNTVSGAYTNSGTINAIVGTSTLTGQTSFTNTGLINLQDGAANDQLTINSSFNGGAGSTLAVDTSDTTSDLLVITGAISGTTTVDANLIGTGALVVGGVQVVDGQSTSTDGAFVLGDITGNAGPLTTYEIVQDGSDYYLNGSLTAAGFEPLAAASMVPDLWHPSADEVFANLNVPYKGGPGLGGWVQAYASRDKRGDRDLEQTVGGIDYSVNTRVKTTRYGFQGGVDYGLNDTTRVGLTGGYSQHNGKGAVDVDANGWNIGLYAGFGGVSGFHGEFLAKHDRYKLEFQNGAFDGDRLTAKANGLEGQLGYRMPMGGAEDSNLDIVAGLSHVWNKLDGVSAFGLDYDYDDLDSFRGRVGARYNVGGAMQPYVSATLLHEFSRNGTLYVDDGVNALAFETRKKGTWGRIEGGIGGTPNGFPMIAAWADLGDVKGIGARLGMRFGASAPAPAPAPVIAPPAPVEPAPATQTCYDGSVILATDTCPVPPPPPAPTPAPERG